MDIAAVNCRQRPTVPPPLGKWNWWHPSYCLDWMIALFLNTSAAVLCHWSDVRRTFFLQAGDPRFAYPFQSNNMIMEDWRCLFALVFLCPVLLLLLWQQARRRSLHELHHSVLGLVLASGVALFTATLICIAVGMPRPNYFQSSEREAERRSSFPSRSACALFASWTFLMMFALGQSGTFHQELVPPTNVLIAMAPLIVPTSFALLQICTYVNHVHDVVVAALLGGGSAVLFYRVYFEELWMDSSNEAKKRSKTVRYNLYGFPIADNPPFKPLRATHVSLVRLAASPSTAARTAVTKSK
jgi:hypothetical protein